MLLMSMIQLVHDLMVNANDPCGINTALCVLRLMEPGIAALSLAH